jgi:hypothetical protein
MQQYFESGITVLNMQFSVDADFGLIAAQMNEMEKKRSFFTVAYFDGLMGREKVVFPHVDAHAKVYRLY